MNFEGQTCPECSRGQVKVVHSNSGGWYYGCSRFSFTNADSCNAAWQQNGLPYRSATHALRKRSFWSWLFG
jgi:hypothetical protein